MTWQMILGFILTQVVPGLQQLFVSVIVPMAAKLLKFTLRRLSRIPIYLRLLLLIYTDSEPNSEARRYLTSVLLVLGSILSFMAYCYISLTGAFIVSSFMTPVAAMIALVVSLVALDSVIILNHDYFHQKYPDDIQIIEKDIEDLKNLLGSKKWSRRPKSCSMQSKKSLILTEGMKIS